MRRSRRIVGIRLARRRRRTRPPRRGGESVSDGGQPGAPFGPIRVLLRHKGADSELALQRGHRGPAHARHRRRASAGRRPARPATPPQVRTEVTRCMSSPAASSGDHRVPDPARDTRYAAAVTAGAEREDAPSEQRHRAARRSARRAAPSRTTSSERSRPRLPRTEPSALSGARRHAGGWPPSRGAHSRAPIQCRRAPHTAGRIHRRSGPTRRPHAPSNSPGGRQAVRHSADRTEQHADRTESTPSRTPY